MLNNNGHNIKYIAYLRKSTDDNDHQILSLDTQSGIIKNLELKFNIQVCDVITEKQSAKKPGREGFNRMIEMILANKANGIVVWSAHRLSRNAQDTAQLISLFDEGKLQEIITESYTFRKTPMDVFMLGFHCAQAKLENDCKAIDVKKGMETSARKGIYPGKPPLGYLSDIRGVKGNRKREIDPLRFKLVRKIWDEILTGNGSPKTIWEKANNVWNLRNRNGQRLSLSNIYFILHNPFYSGEFKWPKKNGITYKGIHKPMISKEEFLKVQEILRQNSRPRPIKKYFPYGNCLFHCGDCGGALSGYDRFKVQKNGNKHHYVYYQCTKKNGTCKQTGVREEILESQISNALKSISVPESIRTFILNLLQSDSEKHRQELLIKEKNTSEAYNQSRLKIDGLIDLRSRNQINEEQFQRLKTEAEIESQRLSTILSESKYKDSDWINFTEKALEFGNIAYSKFKKGSPETKRMIVENLGSNLTIMDKSIDFTKEKWIKLIQELNEGSNDNTKDLEPLKPLKSKDNSVKLINFFLLCSRLKDVRTCFDQEPNRKWFSILDDWNKKDGLQAA